jgi:hypothetical protein
VAQQFKSLLNGDPELRPLLAKTQALSVLQRHFASIAPPYLAQSSQVLGLQHGTLNIAVANSAIAAKLRQLAPELALLLQGKGCEVSGIRVKVQVDYARRQPEQVPRTLTRTAQNALDELSQKLGDSPLKYALEKMIRKKS